MKTKLRKPDETEPTSLFSVRISTVLKDTLSRLAASDGRSLNNYIARVLGDHASAAGGKKNVQSDRALRSH